MKKLLISLLILTATPVWAQAVGGIAISNVENYFKLLDGVVVEVSSEDTLLVDIGSSKGAVPGLMLTIYQSGEPIVHPITGKVLGYKEGIKGTVTIAEVFEEYSSAKYTGTAAIGERIAIDKPVPVAFQLNNLNDEDMLVISTAIKANSTIVEATGQSEALYTVSINRTGQVLSYEVAFADKTLYANTAVPQSTAGSKDAISAIANAELPKGRYLSLAVGNIQKGNAERLMVAVQDDVIDIFEIETFTKVGEIKARLNDIAAVEVADMDADGVDEIFVSNTTRGSYAQSAVFRHDGQNYVEVQREIPFLFRSITDIEGKRRIIAQEITMDGEYAGEIFYLSYKNGKYEKGNNITGTVGKRLMAFSMTAEGENFVQIGKDNRLTLSTFRETFYASTDYFGDTFHNIKPSSNTGSGRADTYGSDPSPADIVDHTIYIPPRIEVIAGKYIVLVKNNIYSRLFQQSLAFSTSEIGIYQYEYSQMLNKGIVRELDPVITDVFTYNDKGIDYLIALTSSNNWGVLKGNSSIAKYRVDVR